MAEVKSGFHSKKPPSFSNNGFTVSSSSTSSKHIYDDVFSCPPSRKLKSSELSTFGDDDFAEIFGSSKSENGVWQSPSSSIPIFNIPESEHRGKSRGGVDYSGVFGGFGDGGLDLPDGEELFDQMKKKAKTSGSDSVNRSKEQTTEATTSHISRHSENGQRRTRGFSQSFESVKHFEHQTEMTSNEPNGATYVFHTNPRRQYEFDPLQKTQTSSTHMVKEHTEVSMGAHMTKEGKHSKNASLEFGANEQKRVHDASFQKASHWSGSNSTAPSHETLRNTVAGPSKQVKEVAKVQSNVKDGAVKSTSGSTSPNEVGPSQKTENSGSFLTKDNAEVDIDIGLANKKAEPSRNTSLEFKKEEPSESTGSKHAQQASTVDGPSKVVKDDSKVENDIKHDPMEVEAVEPADVVTNKPNSEHDANLGNTSGLNGSAQNGTSCDTSKVNSVVDPPEEVKDEVKADAGPHTGKKQGRHARVTSLDLRDHKQAHQKARFGSSYSFDASHDTFAARVKVQPSKVMPSSSLPQFFPVENHCKVSENSSCKSSENYMYRGGEAGTSPPSLDEQLDVNSAAAVSAAALQRAIEEAEMRIRLAKEFLKREGQGNGKMSFKDTLKLNVGKENNNANEVYEYRQKNVQHHPQAESRMKTSQRLERKSVLEPAQVAPIYGGLKESSKDEELVDGKSAKEPRPIEDNDKCEAGEWEAAKHLNQLISGVKNKIASFMTWQVEPEKKEEPRETEVGMRSEQQFRSKEELKDAEVVKMKEAEIDEYASSSSAYETKDGGSNMGFILEPVKVDENELTRINRVVQDKSSREVDEVPPNEGPTSTSLLFFSFSGERNRKTEVTGGFGAESLQEEIVQVKDGQLQGKSVEANQEGLEDVYMSSSESEGLECDRSELMCAEEIVNEESRVDRTLDEEHADERTAIFHEDNNHDVGPSEECEYDRSEFTYQENRKMGEEFGDGQSDFTYQESERLDDESGDCSSNANPEQDRRTNEECGDDGSDDFTHEENRRLGEECGNDSSEFTHKEDIRLSEEHGVDPSSFIQGEDNDRRPGDKGEGDLSNFPSEQIDDARMNEEYVEELEPLSSYHTAEAIAMAVETDDEREEYEEAENAESQQLDEASDLVGEEIENQKEEIEEINAWEENEKEQGLINDTEEAAQPMDELEENMRDQSEADHTEETENEVADEEYKQTENGFPSDTEKAFGMDGSNPVIEGTVIPDEENEKIMEINGSSSGPEMDTELTPLPNEERNYLMETTSAFSEPENNVENPGATQEVGESMRAESFSTEKTRESDDAVILDDAESTDEALPCDNFELDEKSETDLNCEQTDIDGEVLESESEKISENHTEGLNESAAEAVDVGEKHSSEAGHRRRRWFENGEQVSNADRPGILEGDGASSEVDQEVLEESELAGSVEIHAGKLESEAPEEIIRNATESVSSVEESIRVNAEAALHKRRRWFVNNGAEGIIPEPPSLFGGVNLSSEAGPEIVNESNLEEVAEVVVNAEKSRPSVEATPRRKRWFESGDTLGPNQQQRGDEDERMRVDINQEFKEIGGDTEKSARGKDEEDMHNNTDPVNGDVTAVNKRKKEKEKEKERIAVERAIREARERAFAEARERARRDAVEKQPKMEESQSQRVTDNKPSKASSSEAPSASEKASMLAKMKAERAAVERATAEARERALQKALSEKASHRSREPVGRHQPERNSSFDPKYHSSSSHAKSSDPSSKGEKPDGAEGESAERRKARLERQNRTMERAAKALEEKNKRDLQAQKEQAARNMLADALDIEVKRWSTGKEGNLRALLSTLQYILGSDSGWQPISLTDLVAPTAVRKAYKKATLCVHPDKLQQRGASIQQKYICEKVFDLLKEAWSRFNPDER